MKRYYLSDIIGTGSIEDPIRPRIADVLQQNGIAAGTSYEYSAGGWALCHVACKNHGPLVAAQGVDPLPDFPLDAKISAMQQVTKNDMVSRLAARGIDSGIVGGSDGFRDVIRALGLTQNPNFSELNFDASEPS